MNNIKEMPLLFSHRRSMGLKSKRFMSEDHDERIILFGGSVRSSKSVTTIQYFVKQLIGLEHSCTCGILGYSISTIKTNIVGTFEQYLDDARLNWVKRNFDYELRLKPGVTISVIVVGMRDVLSTARLKGSTLTYVIGDEVNTWHYDGWLMLLSRLSTNESQFVGTFNPTTPGHWLEEYINHSVENNSLYLHFTLDDNPNLPEGYIEFLKRQYPPSSVEYKRYVLGVSCVAEGLIYTGFNDENIKEDVSTDLAWEYRYVGIDYSNQRFAATLFVKYGAGLMVMKELFYHSKPVSDDILVAMLQSEFDLNKQYDTIYTPHDALSLYALLTEYGFSVSKYKPDALNDIGKINTLFHTNRVFVYEGCTELIKALQNYSWDRVASEKGVDKPVEDLNKDLCDSLRGPIVSMMVRRSRITAF